MTYHLTYRCSLLFAGVGRGGGRTGVSTTRSCSILCELYQQAVIGAEEQLVDLVECILTSVRAEHIESGNASLSDHMLEILMTCVEECNPLPPRVLEAILVSLLPSARKENPPSCYLAKKLLGRCSEPLSDPVSDCLNALLTGSSSSCDERFLCSELSEHVMAVRACPQWARAGRRLCLSLSPSMSLSLLLASCRGAVWHCDPRKSQEARRAHVWAAWDSCWTLARGDPSDRTAPEPRLALITPIR